MSEVIIVKKGIYYIHFDGNPDIQMFFFMFNHGREKKIKFLIDYDNFLLKIKKKN